MQSAIAAVVVVVNQQVGDDDGDEAEVDDAVGPLKLGEERARKV